VSHYKTINEVRQDAGLEPLEKGGDIVLNQTFVTALSMGDEEGMDEGADFDDAETEDEGADFDDTETEDEGADFEKANPHQIKVSIEL